MKTSEIIDLGAKALLSLGVPNPQAARTLKGGWATASHEVKEELRDYAHSVIYAVQEELVGIFLEQMKAEGVTRNAFPFTAERPREASEITAMLDLGLSGIAKSGLKPSAS